MTSDKRNTPVKRRRAARYVRLPLPVLKFLLGIAPLNGVWFGQQHPTKYGKFWWRSEYFRKHYSRVNATRGDM